MDGRERDSHDPERAERLREEARERWGRADDDADAVAARLDSDDPAVRAEAVWTLAELAADDPDRSRRLPVESKLAPLLNDDDQWVRRGASWAVATIADEHPHRAHAALPAVTESLADEDPLVRENGVLALSNVAEEYPRAVEPALSKLAALVADEDGLARRYAVETLRRLVVRLDEGGFPETVEATPEIAEMLRGEGDVVAVSDDADDGRLIRIRGGGADDESADDDDESDGTDGTDESLGPPDRIPAVPEIDGDRETFERLADLGTDPLTTATKARAPSSEGGQHVVVVVRTLRPDSGVDPSRFETALRSWVGVDDHAHVAPVLARGTDPRPWFASEFMDAGSLRKAVGSVGFDRAVWYAHCLAATMCHAHARGVVHGALRPGAVGLSRTFGAWPVPKVGDWAFGDLFADATTPPVPPAYAAPEHLAPETFGRPDPATDVYQLGALCYALFAGRPPFTGDPADIARKVQNEDPEPPSAHAEGVPEAIDRLVGRALRTEKPARFETAEDFRRELEILARDLSLSYEL
ncbi:HEAT repeat domain-containing protein [Halorussus caseinilyticus]|uniref:HEAT repeat domain-containing protein n=1 Tax=Halorussus caseinilyticus TaxID=3034025 RepID=A0ABD5WEV5_9EURY|nr:HEAT repeat domain-containing protein [Halorussus sp. DT72]